MATDEGGEVPAVPTCVEEFTKSWAEFVLGRWLAGQERGAEGLVVTKVNALLNSQQVQPRNFVSRIMVQLIVILCLLSGRLFQVISCAKILMNGCRSPNPCCSISFHPLADNRLHQNLISFSLRREFNSFPTSLISPREKLPDIFLAFLQTSSYCSSFFLPSITDEVTIYSISFLVPESMELPLPFWRINLPARLLPPYLGFSFAQKFDLQGLLSTTYLVEIFFHTANGEEEGEEKKSVFVKVPLTGEAGKNFKQVIPLEFEYPYICTNM